MGSHVVTSNTEAAILARLMQSNERELPPEVARYILSIQFTPGDLDRINELSEKAQNGDLTDQEQIEMESYLHVGNLISIMQSKARRSLVHNRDCR